MSTFSVTAAHTSIECEPLGTISGSTMGTRPFFCSGSYGWGWGDGEG